MFPPKNASRSGLASVGKLVVGAACLAALSACATVTRGPNVDFNVVTEPAGAKVTTNLLTPDSRRDFARFERDGGMDAASFSPVYFGCEATPCSFEVSRRSEFDVTIERDGYHPVTVSVQSGFVTGNDQADIAGGFLVTPEAANAAIVASGIVITASGLIAASSAITYSSYLSSAAVAGLGIYTLGAGALAVGVDLASGSMLNLSPNPLILVMVPDDQAVPENTGRVIDDPDELLRLLDKQSVSNGPPTSDASDAAPETHELSF